MPPVRERVTATAQRLLGPPRRRTRALRRALLRSDDLADWASTDPRLLDAITTRPEVVRRVVEERRVREIEPPLDIEVDATPEQLAALFDRIATTWSDLGDDEPFWSVISRDDFRAGATDEAIDRFYALGEINLEQLEATLRRCGRDPDEFASVLEFGCGVGRVSWCLARRFGGLVAADVSAPHLELARRRLRETGQRARFVHVTDTSSVDALPSAALVYSVIVLQHNPPPVIDFLLRRLLDRIEPGGAAVLQLLTYRPGYRFRIDDYLADGASAGDEPIEMHVLPQRRTFDAISDQGCRLVEILPDSWAGNHPRWLSNTLVVERRT